MKIKILIVLILAFKLISAQDSLNIIHSWRITEFDKDSISMQNDTSLTFFQNYNPLFYNSIQNISTGNLGLPMYDILFFNRTNNDMLLSNSINRYFTQSPNVQYYNTKKPFTKFFWTNGGTEEQTISIIHTQNIDRYTNFGITYNVISTLGSYRRQSTGNKALTLFFSHEKNRYSIFSNFIYTKFNNFENGGLENDSLFENTDITAENIPVKLNSAQNTFKYKSIYVHQFFKFGKIHSSFQDTLNIKNDIDSLQIKDTIANIDSLKGIDSVNVNKIYDTHYKYIISHTSNINQKYRLYKNGAEDMGFYQNIYNTPSLTLDSIYTHQLRNEISFANSPYQSKTLRWKLSYINKIDKYHNYDTDTLLINSIIHIAVQNKSTNKLFWGFNANYYFLGNNAGTYNAKLTFKYSLRKDSITRFIATDILTQKKEPSFFVNNYSTNNFMWKNIYNEKENKLSISYNDIKAKFKIGINASQIHNMVYFDTNTLPQQLNNSATIYSVFANKNFALGRWHFNNNIYYQKTNVPEICIPEFVSSHSLYVEFAFLKGDFPMQLGTDIYFYSKYKAYSYMPASGIFYLQNDKEIGNYPLVNVFLTMKREHVRFFLKFEHINAGTTGRNYYAIDTYPMNARTFKFGLSWHFYN